MEVVLVVGGPWNSHAKEKAKAACMSAGGMSASEGAFHGDVVHLESQ